MKTLYGLLALILCLAQPAAAQTPGQGLLLFAGGNKPTISLNFGAAAPGFSAPLTSLSPAFLANIAFSRPSLATMADANGNVTEGPNNLLTYSALPSNANWGNAVSASAGGQTITFTGGGGYFGQVVGATAATKYILTCTITGGTKSGSVVLRDVGGGASGSTTVSLASYPVTASVILSVSSGAVSPGFDNRTVAGGDGVNGTIVISNCSFSAVTYETTPRPVDQVITTAAAYYGPRFTNTYGVANSPLGLLIEEARTNLYLNSTVPATQTITVASGSAYTISFYGTGTLTLSGACTQVMTGSAGVRTTYTCTTATTSLVATDAALTSTAYPQVELGAFATSTILTVASSVTRAADAVQAKDGLLACLTGSKGSAIVKTTAAQASHTATLLSANAVVMLGETSANATTTALTASLTSSSTATWTGAVDTGLAWGPSTGTIGLNGVFTKDSGNARTPAAPVYLGSTSGSSAFLDGDISSIACYNTQLVKPQ
jgi:hypothetical protein